MSSKQIQIAIKYLEYVYPNYKTNSYLPSDIIIEIITYLIDTSPGCYILIDDKPHGLVTNTIFYNDIESCEYKGYEHRNYKYGKLDGISRIYDCEDFLVEEIHYTDGKKNGIHIKYSLRDNGIDLIETPIKKTKYSRGKRHGCSRRYDIHGRITSVRNYKENKLYGNCTYFNYTKNKKIKCRYMNNRLVNKRFIPM